MNRQPLRPEHGVSGNDELTLPVADGPLGRHTLPSRGMGCALEWLIWAPCVTLVLQSPFHVEWLCVACFVIAGSAIDVTVRDGGWRLLRPGQGLAGV